MADPQAGIWREAELLRGLRAEAVTAIDAYYRVKGSQAQLNTATEDVQAFGADAMRAIAAYGEASRTFEKHHGDPGSGAVT
jgi:hypothetical protein